MHNTYGLAFPAVILVVAFEVEHTFLVLLVAHKPEAVVYMAASQAALQAALRVVHTEEEAVDWGRVGRQYYTRIRRKINLVL